MDNTIAKQSQFPFLNRPVPGIPNMSGLFAQFMNTHPYLSPYFNTALNPNVSWLTAANSSPNCPSPISPSSTSLAGKCPICRTSMQGIDANQHFIEEAQKLENFRKKDAEEKNKSDKFFSEIENQNDENRLLDALIHRGSRFTARYQTYLKIKQNRELRKMRSYRKKMITDEKILNTISSPNFNSFNPHPLNHFNFSAAQTNLNNNLHNNLLLHQHQAQLLASQANQQHANNQSSLLINGILNAVAAATCNSPARSSSNQANCLDSINESALSNGLSNSNNLNSLTSNGLTNGLSSLGNSQSNDLSQDRTTPGSTSSTPLTNLSSINGSTNLNGTNHLNNTTNGNTSPTSTHTNSPVTQLNGSNNVVSSLQSLKTSPANNAIWSIAHITSGLNQNLNTLNNLSNLNNLNNELKRCLSDEEDEDLEITDDRDSIASNK